MVTQSCIGSSRRTGVSHRNADLLLYRDRRDGADSGQRRTEEDPGGHLLSRLATTIAQRARRSAQGLLYRSAARSVESRKASQKVGEEAVEVVVAANSEDDERLASEAADLLYHLLVLLQAAGSRSTSSCGSWSQKQELSQGSRALDASPNSDQAMIMAFVHLHTHSEYSLLDGANRIPELVAHVKKLGMDSLAVTDHGNMHAAWGFYEHAKAQKIRPDPGLRGLSGVRAAARPGRSRPGRPRRTATSFCWRATAPAIRIWFASPRSGSPRVSIAGPRIDKDVLAAHSEGMVCLAACLSGEVALHLRQGRYEEARTSAEWFSKTFGPDGFWLEIQQHGIPEERAGHRGNAAAGPGTGARRRGHQRRALSEAGGRRVARRAARHRHRQRSGRSQAVPLHRPGIVRQVRKRKCRRCFRTGRRRWPTPQRVADLCEFDFEKRYFLPGFPRPAEYASDEALLEPPGPHRRASGATGSAAAGSAGAAHLRARRHQHARATPATS